MAKIAEQFTELAYSRLDDAISLKRQIRDSDCIGQVATVALAIITTLRGGGKVLFFGNGGSAMDAGHLAAELAGRFYRDRPGLGLLPARRIPRI